MGPGDHEDEPLDEHGPGHDEGSDEDLGPTRGAPPDPLDRTWLHPTELPPMAAGAAPTATTPAPAHHRRPQASVWLVPLIAGAVGALATVMVLSLSGSLDTTPNDGNPSSSGVAGALAPTAADAAARLGASIVAVAVRDSRGTRQGSGVCVRHGGEVLTTARIVGDAKTVEVVTADGVRHTARVLGTDRATDLALLTIEGAEVPAAQLADVASASGSRIWVLGAAAPGTKSSWMSGGMIATTDALVAADAGPNTAGLVETDAATGITAAGGALVYDSGRVSGIVLGRVDNGGTSYAVPIATATAVAEALHDGGPVKHGWIGLDGSDLPAGTVVTTTTKNGPAAKAGVRRGDRIDAVNGRLIESTSDLKAVVHSLEPGQTVEVALWRAKMAMTVKMTVGARAG